MDTDLPQSGANEPTERVREDVASEARGDVTERLPRDWSGGVEGALPGQGRLLTLREGDRIAGRYRIEAVLRNHGRLESGLYLCTTEEGGERVFVRIHGFARPPDRELLERVRQLEIGSVVRILDVAEHEGSVVEVQEYCAGGALSGYCPGGAGAVAAGAAGPVQVLDAERVSNEVVPAVAEALVAIHGAGVVHGDLKPENLLFRGVEEVDGQRRGLEVVIADLDLAAMVPDERSAVLERTAAGTPAFMAPERFYDRRDVETDRLGKRVGPESDYYAFGVTILRLLGKPALEGLDWNQVADFHGRGERIEIPADLPEDLRNLLGWLLQRDYRRRAGARELRQWLAGELPPAPADDRPVLGRAVRPYRFRDAQGGIHECHDPETLAAALEGNTEQALRELMERDWIVGWLTAIDTELARRVDEARERFRSQPDLALLATQLILDPTRRLELPGSEGISKWAELSAAAGSGPWEGARWRGAAAALRSGRLAVWLELARGGCADLAETARELADATDDPQIALEELLWRVDPERAFHFDAKQALQSPAQIADAILGEEAAWTGTEPPPCYQEGVRQVESGRILAWLRARGYQEIVDRFERVPREGLSGPARTEHLLRLLDPTLPPVHIVLELPMPLQEPAWGFRVPYGSRRRIAVPYRVRGRGLPVGGVMVSSELPALTIADPELEQRAGSFSLEIDGRDVQGAVNSTFDGRLRFELLNAVVEGLEERELPFRYTITYPNARSLRRLGRLALAGFFTAALLSGLVHARSSWLPSPGRGQSWQAIFDTIWQVDRSHGAEFGVFFLLVAAAMVVGARVAMRLRGERE